MRKRRRHRERPRRGFAVYGVTKRFWWDDCRKDTVGNARQRVKRDIMHHMKAWGMA